MQKQAPTLPRIATMALFALSCFGLLMYLWTAFGGPTPFSPKGYRFTVSFAEATQLAEQADVRISGVPVGKVVDLRRDDAGRTLATVEMRPRYAPLPRDARAVLRLKTLLGETFVELTPGSPGAPKLPEGAMLPRAQVQPTVELDEVLRALDEPTRRELQRWLHSWAAALDGRGGDLSDALGNAAPTAVSAASLLEILDAQERAVRHGIRDTGRVFGALGRREAATRTVVRAGERVLRTTAAREDEVRRILRILPTFEDELRPALEATRGLVRDAAPVLRALRPAAPRLRPVLRNSIDLAPDLRAALGEIDPIVRRSRTALPAATRIVRELRPVLRLAYPVLRDAVPVVDYLGRYRSEVATSWMNVAASTQATFQPPGAKEPIHYLRVLVPAWNEALVQSHKRQPSNRHNPYLAPRGLEKLATGLLESFDCANTANPQTIPVLGSAPRECKVQQPFEVGGRRTAFPRLQRAAP